MDSSVISRPDHPVAARAGSSRGAIWLAALTHNAPQVSGYPATVQVADAPAGLQREGLSGVMPHAMARYIAVVPDPSNPFYRVRKGEVGLVEGWALAQAVDEVIAADRGQPAAEKRPVIAVVDVVSQAYGRNEEAYGIHQALAGAAAAYARARLAGHPVVALLVGKAMSGGFLAHGYQANRLIALNDPGVMVHAMGKEAAARITQRSVRALDALAASVPPMAYDIQSFISLGLAWRSLTVMQPDSPTEADRMLVEASLADAIEDIRRDPVRDLSCRLGQPLRGASQQVRIRLRAGWNDAADMV